MLNAVTEAEICREPNDPNFKGFVVGCHWETRTPNEGLWLVNKDGYVLPLLDRYAIIPLEKYRELIGRHEEQSIN
jgi:hypothetical protein